MSFYYGSGMLRRNIRHYAVFLLSGGICENIRRLKLCYLRFSGDGTYDYIAIIDCNESVTKIEILAEIEDIPVVEIESSAFNGCTSLTSIKIPDSVTSIGN